MLKNTLLQNLSVTDPLHPTLELQILDGGKNQQLKVPALIDTGFDSYLSIPFNLAQELQLEIVGETEIEVATDHNFLVQICICRFTITGINLPNIEVEAIVSDDGELLIGTKYLQFFFDKFGIDFNKNQIIYELN